MDDRRETLQLRHMLQDLLDETAERHDARQVGAVGGDVDARQHDSRRSRLSVKRRTSSTTSPAGTEREGPRANGMMQNVQR